MPVILSVSPAPKGRGRLLVCLESGEEFELQARTMERFPIGPGDVISWEALETLTAEDQAGAAMESALRLLAERPRSTREIERRLAQKGFQPGTVAIATSRLSDLGYLDDAEFARNWVENRDDFRPRGSRQLRSELGALGVDRSQIGEALEQRESSDLEQARKLAAAKERSLASLPPKVREQRLTGLLGRRGFDYSTIRRVLEELGEASEEEESTEFES